MMRRPRRTGERSGPIRHRLPGQAEETARATAWAETPGGTQKRRPMPSAEDATSKPTRCAAPTRRWRAARTGCRLRQNEAAPLGSTLGGTSTSTSWPAEVERRRPTTRTTTTRAARAARAATMVTAAGRTAWAMRTRWWPRSAQKPSGWARKWASGPLGTLGGGESVVVGKAVLLGSMDGREGRPGQRKTSQLEHPPPGAKIDEASRNETTRPVTLGRRCVAICPNPRKRRISSTRVGPSRRPSPGEEQPGRPRTGPCASSCSAPCAPVPSSPSTRPSTRPTKTAARGACSATTPTCPGRPCTAVTGASRCACRCHPSPTPWPGTRAPAPPTPESAGEGGAQGQALASRGSSDRTARANRRPCG